MRLDLFLVENHLAETRTRAKNLIELKKVSVNGKIIDKPACFVTEKDAVTLSEDYGASLGGLKLQEAFRHRPIDLTGKRCLDIGAANGGFCDVLLQNGAARVIALDVGECALPDRLRDDERIIIMDKTNARFLKKEDLPYTPDFISVDVSFISLTQILPTVATSLADGAVAVCLVKPQFECGKKALSKTGIVTDKKAEKQALDFVMQTARALSLTPIDFCPAPHPFDKKNQEYLLFLQKQ